MNDTERDNVLLELQKNSQKSNITLSEVVQVLKGYNGDEGLCEKVENHTRAINKLWIAITVMSVSIGGGTYGIIRAIMG